MRPNVRTLAAGGKFLVTDYSNLDRRELLGRQADLAAKMEPSCIRRAETLLVSFRYCWSEARSLLPAMAHR